MTQSLELHPATLDDIPTLVEIWYDAFSDKTMRHLWPNRPNVHEWWRQANSDDMQRKPFQKYLKVIDRDSQDAQGRPRIVAWAKWDLSMPEQRGPRFPAWHAEQPAGDNDAFFAALEKSRVRVMGDRKHYYLDMLCARPEEQRRGAGGMLVKWGCDRADEDGVEAYVDASETGKALYEKFGFVNYSLPGEGVAAMARNNIRAG